MLKAVFFDLDGTLLPMDEQEFTKVYFDLISNKMKDYDYDKEKLISTIWSGTKKMYENNGAKTNEEVFWNCFKDIYGIEKIKDKEVFDSFYLNEFKNTINACGKNDEALNIVKYVKNKGLKVILSTNPIFPYQGTLTRMNFVNLKESDFDYITAYENSSYTKPNPKYFKVLLNKFDLLPSEVILFGNNDIEDFYCSFQAGITCYLVGNNLILHEDKHINCPKIQINEIIKTINIEYEKRLK